MTITVLLVDDEPLVRSGLRTILSTAPDIEVVGEVDDGAAVPSAVAELRPAVVVMDVRMPRIDGIAATRRLLATPSPPRVLVVTTFENDSYVYEALRAGAAGFLLKRSPPAEIRQGVRTVAAGDSLLYPAAIRDLANRHGHRSETPQLRRLTDQERRILRLMTRGLSNADIAAELVVSVETVKTHVSSLLRKLEVRDRTQAVIAAYESGFVTPGEDP